MKVLLAAPPFSGHLHPILGIAKRLAQDQELEIIVVSTPSAKEKVENEHIKFISILEGFDQKIENIANPATKVKSHPIKLYKQLKENIGILKELKNQFENIVEQQKPDLIIADFTLPVIGIVAKEKGITWHTTLPSPCVYESEGVPAYLGGLYPAKSSFEKLKYKTYHQLIKYFKKTCFNIFKKQLTQVGLQGIYDKQGNELIYSLDKVYALGIKELEFNLPKQPQFCYVGPVLYTPKIKNEKDITFENNKKYVLVTMGTHLKFLKEELVNQIKKLSNNYPDLEFHITIGDEKDNIEITEKNVKVLHYISYEKHLKSYSYVVHHGGSGILYECIKHGIASMVFPQDYDQFDNAARLDYYGLSVKVNNYGQLATYMEKLLVDHKLLENVRHYQRIYNTYSACEEIYKEVKMLSIKIRG